MPVAGTMAHSFVQACDSEREAFRRLAEAYPDTTLLVDTYDTLEGVRRVIGLARELGPDFKVKAIRLDSGDLRALAFGARALLDDAGLSRVQIFASGGLDEHKIAALIDAPIDAFGVGTDMSVSTDAPALDIAYELCAYAGEGRLKLSTGKRTLPGRKQVFRGPEGDVIARYGESFPGERLLRPVMRDGRIVLLAARVVETVEWARRDARTSEQPIGLFGASAGAAAAAAARGRLRSQANGLTGISARSAMSELQFTDRADAGHQRGSNCARILCAPFGLALACCRIAKSPPGSARFPLTSDTGGC